MIVRFYRCFAVTFGVIFLALVFTSALQSAPLPQLSKDRPLSFEANEGQTGRQVRLLARNLGSTVFLTDREAVLTRRTRQASDSWRMRFVGANPSIHAEGVDPLSGKINYFIGRDPRNWHTDIPTYGRVTYSRIYRGIDLTFYGDQHRLEYDFVVSPDADPSSIKLDIRGSSSRSHLRIDENGDLVAQNGANQMRFHKPDVYQPSQAAANTSPEFVEAHYVLRAGNVVGFAIGPYDHTRTLVIDPVVTYSTYFGGSDDEGIFGIKPDIEGNLYVSGETSSPNFPAESAVQSKLGGSYDGFVSKFDPSGSHLIYATYLGGSSYDHCVGLAVDLNGNAYVAGLTQSPDFPVFHALQSSLHGQFNAFISELDPSGSRFVFSTYLGGSRSDQAGDIALGIDGGIYVTGYTNSIDFPVTVGAYQNACDKGLNHGFCIADAFVAKLSPGGSKLLYSTYLGGSSYDSASGIAVDFAGAAYITGQTNSSDFPAKDAYQSAFGGASDVFLTKLNAEGTDVVFSTYFGGSGYDAATAIALDLFRNIYLIGNTSSADFPVRRPFQSVNKGGSSDGFVAKFNRDGRTLVYSSYLGGSGFDYPFRAAVDIFGSLSILGFTTSLDFPVNDAPQPKFAGGSYDAFVTKLSPAGSKLLYSTYLGGTGDEFGYAIYSDPIGDVWVGGSTSSRDFPIRNAFQAEYAGGPFDAFLTKYQISPIWGIESVESMLLSLIGPEVQRQEAEPLLASLGAAKQHLEAANYRDAVESLRIFDRELQRLINEQGRFPSTGPELHSASQARLNRITEDPDR